MGKGAGRDERAESVFLDTIFSRITIQAPRPRTQVTLFQMNPRSPLSHYAGSEAPMSCSGSPHLQHMHTHAHIRALPSASQHIHSAPLHPRQHHVAPAGLVFRPPGSDPPKLPSTLQLHLYPHPTPRCLSAPDTHLSHLSTVRTGHGHWEPECLAAGERYTNACPLQALKGAAGEAPPPPQT